MSAPGAGLEAVAAGARVLIVEDDAASARVLRSILQQSGCEVALARDGDEALRMLEEEGPPDLMLLDWMLPGVSGLEVCHRARSRWDAAALPILMVTAKTDPESAYAAFDAGASDYVPKPFRAVEIRARVAAHLRTRRLAEERRRMEDRLREREKLSSLGLLASGVAHELNNPLAVIAGHAQLLLRRETDPGAAEQLREVLEAAARCRKITGDLLGFARRRPAVRTTVDLAAVARATLALRERALRAAGVQVAADLPEGLPPVLADAHQLQQVFLNLLLNAEAALRGSAGHLLRVAARPEATGGGSVVVEVFNDGPPIPAEVFPRIFEPFFTTKGEEEGTGLGLPISLRIVQEHGGDLEAESGEAGTAFRVRLPVWESG